MTKLNLNDFRDPPTVKYTRDHLLSLFDALHLNNQFASIGLEDFPERSTPRTLQLKRQPKFDINDDSDGASVPDSDEPPDREHDRGPDREPYSKNGQDNEESDPDNDLMIHGSQQLMDLTNAMGSGADDLSDIEED